VRRWFDGHLDLAYLAEHGRDLMQRAENCGGGLQPASVTFPALAMGNVRAAFATIFVQRRVGAAEAERRGEEPTQGTWCFDSPDEAYLACLRQFARYELWDNEGAIRLATGSRRRRKDDEAVEVMLLLEGAAGVRSVADFQEFYDAGVRIVALTWNEGTIWAGGDRSGGDVTAAGLELIAELDRLGCVHDVSHLSEAAFWTLMGKATGPKIASHSNCRALLPGKKFPERNLSDEQIQALVAAGGIIGVNLFSPFLVSSEPGAPRRAGIDDVLRHLRHFEEVTGRRDFLALGSDFDGGYPRTSWAERLDGPELLPRLGDTLAAAGWSDAEIERFAWGNWTHLTERTLSQGNPKTLS
jgi:membrane dipeptidase